MAQYEAVLELVYLHVEANVVSPAVASFAK
jgi:hypothetical protein